MQNRADVNQDAYANQTWFSQLAYRYSQLTLNNILNPRSWNLTFNLWAERTAEEESKRANYFKFKRLEKTLEFEVAAALNYRDANGVEHYVNYDQWQFNHATEQMILRVNGNEQPAVAYEFAPISDEDWLEQSIALRKDKAALYSYIYETIPTTGSAALVLSVGYSVYQLLSINAMAKSAFEDCLSSLHTSPNAGDRFLCSEMANFESTTDVFNKLIVPPLQVGRFLAFIGGLLFIAYTASAFRIKAPVDLQVVNQQTTHASLARLETLLERPNAQAQALLFLKGELELSQLGQFQKAVSNFMRCLFLLACGGVLVADYILPIFTLACEDIKLNYLQTSAYEDIELNYLQALPHETIMMCDLTAALANIGTLSPDIQHLWIRAFVVMCTVAATCPTHTNSTRNPNPESGLSKLLLVPAGVAEGGMFAQVHANNIPLAEVLAP
jgi:hypothetical protein